MVIKKTHLLKHELCYSISKSINDKKDKFKSFTVFKIATHIPIFRLIKGSSYYSLSQKKKKSKPNYKIQNTLFSIFLVLFENQNDRLKWKMKQTIVVGERERERERTFLRIGRGRGAQKYPWQPSQRPSWGAQPLVILPFLSFVTSRKKLRRKKEKSWKSN